jgi:hypothetical protein
MISCWSSPIPRISANIPQIVQGVKREENGDLYTEGTQSPEVGPVEPDALDIWL